MPKHNFRAVVLDLFDTLVKWDPTLLPEIEWRGRRLRSTIAYQIEALRSRLDDFDSERWLDTYHSVMQEILAEREQRGIEITCDERFALALKRFDPSIGERFPTLVRELTQSHMKHVRRVTSAPPERVAAVTRIAPQYRLGLLSNFDDSETGHQILDDTGISHLFAGVIISADVGLRKPNPMIFERMLKLIGTPAEEILFVGDTFEHDVAASKRAGMRAAWINPSGAAVPEGALKPDFVIGDLGELPFVLGC
jgi:HAD superfamily hydrolase (TIGR01509 family)